MARVQTRYKENDSKERTLEEYEFESMSHWLHHTLMVMTHICGFHENPAWIKHLLFDLSSEKEINSILQRLLELSLLARSENGKLIQTNRQVKTKPELRHLSAKIFYSGLLSRAAQALELTDSEQREYCTYFVGLSPSQLPEIKKRVREFMKSLNELALSNPNPHQVYSFTFCGFPLSRKDTQCF
jgi:uncharacterized protein (TIGR02147 family)